MKTWALLLFTTGLLFSPWQHDPKTKISQLSWLAGYWLAETNGTNMEELWLPASGNIMIGVHRDTFKNGEVFFEYLRIVEMESGISYMASPRGKPPTEFKLKRLSDQQVIFENPEHDFPQRIIYQLKSDSILIARIEGQVEGELKYRQWEWHKTELKVDP